MIDRLASRLGALARSGAVLSLCAAAGAAPLSAASAGSPRAGSWVRTGTQNVGTGHNELFGVAYAGASAWAVGDFFDGVSDRALVERWNGASWLVSSTPDASTLHNSLAGVAGSSGRDVWAVGRYEPPVGQERTLTLHWNGASWRIAPSPNEGAYHNELDSVVDLKPSDVWAVGHFDLHRSITDEALVEHWNGAAWSVVPCVHPPLSHSGFASIAHVPRSAELWAVGYLIRGRVTRTLVELWTGRRWSMVPSPDVGLSHNELDSVSATSPTNAWAVGFFNEGTGDHPLVEHWNGRRWSVVPVAPSALHEVLAGVVATSAGAAIAVGDAYYGTADRTLIVAWNGRRWSHEPSPDAGGNHNVLSGVAASPIGAPIAVGTFFSGAADQALALRRG